MRQLAEKSPVIDALLQTRLSKDLCILVAEYCLSDIVRIDEMIARGGKWVKQAHQEFRILMDIASRPKPKPFSPIAPIPRRPRIASFALFPEYEPSNNFTQIEDTNLTLPIPIDLIPVKIRERYWKVCGLRDPVTGEILIAQVRTDPDGELDRLIKGPLFNLTVHPLLSNTDREMLASMYDTVESLKGDSLVSQYNSLINQAKFRKPAYHDRAMKMLFDKMLRSRNWIVQLFVIEEILAPHTMGNDILPEWLNDKTLEMSDHDKLRYIRLNLDRAIACGSSCAYEIKEKAFHVTSLEQLRRMDLMPLPSRSKRNFNLDFNNLRHSLLRLEPSNSVGVGLGWMAID